MKGHEPILELRRQGLKPQSVFVFMQDPPKDQYFMDAIRRAEHPEVYVGDKPATRVNLAWVRGISQVHLIPSDNIQNALSWWCALVDAKPNFLITVIDGELSCYQP